LENREIMPFGPGNLPTSRFRAVGGFKTGTKRGELVAMLLIQIKEFGVFRKNATPLAVLGLDTGFSEV
jgi:hypothetical protein